MNNYSYSFESCFDCAHLPPILLISTFHYHCNVNTLKWQIMSYYYCEIILILPNFWKYQELLGSLNHILRTAGIEQENRKTDSCIIILLWKPVLKSLRIIEVYNAKRHVIWIFLSLSPKKKPVLCIPRIKMSTGNNLASWTI